MTAQPALSLWTPPLETADETHQLDGLSPHMTLRQFYERAFVRLWLRAQKRDPKTDRSYCESLDYWERLTENPSLVRITNILLADFVAALCDQPGRAPRGEEKTLSIYTVRKHARQICTILHMAGPPTDDYLDATDLLTRVPATRLPQPDGDFDPEGFTLEEVQALITAADQMTTPRIPGVSTGEWWRSLIIVALYTGFRIGTLRKLRFDWLREHDREIWVPPAAAKRRKAKKQHMRRDTQEAIDDMRPHRSPLVFPWPHVDRHLWTCHGKLCRLAGLPEARWFGFHGYRRLHVTLLATGEGTAELGLKIAQTSAGHASAKTTEQFYLYRTEMQKLAAAANERMPTLERRPSRKHKPLPGQLDLPLPLADPA